MNRTSKYVLALATTLLVLSITFSATAAPASAYTQAQVEQAKQMNQDFGWTRITVDFQYLGLNRYRFTVTFRFEDWLHFINGVFGHQYADPKIFGATAYIKDTDTGSILMQSSISCTYVNKDPYDVYYGTLTYGPSVRPGHYQAYLVWTVQQNNEVSPDWYNINYGGSYAGVAQGGWLPTLGTKGDFFGTRTVTWPVVSWYVPSPYW